MEISLFSQTEKGILFNFLIDAYSASGESIEQFRNNWLTFDSFVFDNLSIDRENQIVYTHTLVKDKLNNPGYGSYDLIESIILRLEKIAPYPEDILYDT